MITQKLHYLPKRVLVQFAKCDSNGENAHGVKVSFFERKDLTVNEAAELDALLEKIIDRMNTAAKPARATDAAASAETKSA